MMFPLVWHCTTIYNRPKMLLTGLEFSLIQRMVQLTQGSVEQVHIYVCSFDTWMETKKRLRENEKQF